MKISANIFVREIGANIETISPRYKVLWNYFDDPTTRLEEIAGEGGAQLIERVTGWAGRQSILGQDALQVVKADLRDVAGAVRLRIFHLYIGDFAVRI